MFTRLSICLLVFLNSGIAFSQLYYLSLPPGHNKLYVGDDRIPGVVGSPYLVDDWSKGNITLYNGKIVNDLNLRYNVYLKEFHYQADNNTYILGSPDSILFVEMGDKRFMYLPFEEKKKSKQKDYFEVLSGDGTAQLLIRHTVMLIKSNFNVALNAGEKNDRLEHKSAYYLKKDNSIVLIDKRGQSLFDLLSDKSRELKDYAMKNHLSFTAKDDLMKIIEYYNSSGIH